MKKYELMAIYKPTFDSAEMQQIVEKVTEFVTSIEGTVISSDFTGRKKLAYEVKGFKEGNIVVFKLELPEASVAKFKRQLKLSENIIRTMFVEDSKVAVKA